MQVFFGIAYLVVGLVQLFAIADGVGYGMGLGGFFSFVVAGLLTYIPLVGSAFGVYGATHAWDWSAWQALTLFFWYVPVYIALSAAGALASR